MDLKLIPNSFLIDSKFIKIFSEIHSNPFQTDSSFKPGVLLFLQNYSFNKRCATIQRLAFLLMFFPPLESIATQI